MGEHIDQHGALIRQIAHELITTANKFTAASAQLARTVAGIGTFSAVATRTGAREDRDFSGFPATPVMLDAFTTVDLSAEFGLPSGLLPSARLHLRVENVGDVRYERIVGFASPGRALYAGVKLRR